MGILNNFELIHKQSDIDISELIRVWPNGRKTLNMKKISELGWGLNIVITPRGGGKTYGTKELAAEAYKKDKLKTIFARNLISDIEAEHPKMLKKHFKNLDTTNFTNCEIGGNIKGQTAGVYLKGEDSPFIQLVSMNSANKIKGARENFKYFIWDEFNESANLVSDLISKYDDLINTISEIVEEFGQETSLQQFIFGNMKSFNNPLFVKFGITSFKWQITEIWIKYTDTGEKFPFALIVIYTPDETEAEFIDTKNRVNGIYNISKVLGTAKHSYFNESLLDNINFIQDLSKMKKSDKHYIATLYHKNKYLNIYYINENSELNKKETIFHCEYIEKEQLTDSSLIKTFRRDDKVENAVYNPELAQTLKEFFYGKKLSTEKVKKSYQCRVSFQDLISRDIFLSALKNL